MTRHNYIISIINEIGFMNIYDDKIIKNQEFEQNVRDTIDFLINEYTVNLKIDMIMHKSRHYITGIRGKSLKALLGFINTHLSTYSIKIASTQTREKGKHNKNNCCRIEMFDNVGELL